MVGGSDYAQAGEEVVAEGWGTRIKEKSKLPSAVVSKARNAGGRFVAISGDTVVGVADTVSDLMLIQALADVDYGQVVEVAGSVVGVVGDIAGGVVEIMGDVDL